ncbi:MAG: TerB family tellurite resistance protein [Rhodospirillales bacterium]|nr:TerB family tellurite resistance protein [Rhodospirillales bacterium]
MLERLKSLFGTDRPDPGAAPGGGESLRLAAAALLVEAARQDGHVDDVELKAIRSLLTARFALSAADCDALLEEGRKAAREATQLYEFVSAVNAALPPERRVEIIEMLWEVVYADGVLNDYEASLVRRVAGLLYVPDQESGAARKRVLDRMETDAGNP